MKRIYNIDDGIGLPDWKLSLCLLLAWIVIGAILMKGVNSWKQFISISLQIQSKFSYYEGGFFWKSGLFHSPVPLRGAHYSARSRCDTGRRFWWNSLFHQSWMAQTSRCQRKWLIGGRFHFVPFVLCYATVFFLENYRHFFSTRGAA